MRLTADKPLLRLLGGARLEVAGSPLSGRATHRRRLALLALLAAAGELGLTRERIVFYLWPERDGDSGRRQLSEALYVLKKDVDDALFLTPGEQVSLNRDVIDADIWRVQAAADARDHGGVVAAYGGDFLDGWYVEDAPDLERWTETERHRFRSLFLAALDALATEAEAAGDLPAALRHLASRSNADPMDSRVAVRYAQALIDSGSSADALRRLQAHEALLRSELDCAPDAAVQSLMQALRDGVAVPRVRTVAPTVTSAPAAEILAVAESALPAETAAERPSRVVPAPAPADAVRVTPRRGTGGTKRVALVAATVVAMVAAAGFWRVRATGAATADVVSVSAERLRVAVMYFDDESPDQTLRPFADMITNGVIDELSTVNRFAIVPRTDVRRFRDRTVPLDSVFAALEAEVLITGTTRIVGDSVRVSVDLVDRDGMQQLATEQFVRGRTDLAGIEADLTQSIATAIRRSLGQSSRRRSSEDGSRNRKARDLVLEAIRERDVAMALTPEPRQTATAGAREALLRADSLLRRARQLDPDWSQPLIDRGWTARAFAALEPEGKRTAQLQQAVAMADSVLARSAQDARALELRAAARWSMVVALDSTVATDSVARLAEADARSAVSIDSTRAVAWSTIAYALWVRGRFVEAELAAKRSVREDAFLEASTEVFDQLFNGALSAGRFAEAREWCTRGRRVVPSDWRFTLCELTLMRHDPAARKDPARAWSIVAKLDTLDPDIKARASGRPYTPIYRRIVAATISVLRGDIARGRAELARADLAARTDKNLRTDLDYDAAYLLTQLGDTAAGRDRLCDLVRSRAVLRPLLEEDPMLRGAGLSPLRCSVAAR